MKISYFLKNISFNKLYTQHMKKLKMNIIYKFKMIFLYVLTH